MSSVDEDREKVQVELRKRLRFKVMSFEEKFELSGSITPDAFRLQLFEPVDQHERLFERRLLDRISVAAR